MAMIDQKKRTVRFETSSLMPLKLVLIEAERDLPERAPKEHDVNEELALKLIAEMRMSLRGAFGKQSPSRYRRLPRHQRAAARNDIQLEP
jgi:hypothetical protein